MRMHRLVHCGSYAFPNDITLDFDSLPEIVAITGKNGSGKTTALDVLTAPLLGEMAYRPGAMSRNFSGPGIIDLTWSLNGQQYRSVLKVDPASDRTEGTLYSADGAVLAGPLIKNYRSEIQKLVGPPEFLLSSMYAVQSGIGAFLTASKAERKSLLSELLGLQRYVIWEAYAKGKVRVAETQLAGLRARVAELGKQVEQIPPLTFRLANLSEEHADASKDLYQADFDLQSTQAALEQARAALAALDPTAAELRQVEQELGALGEQAKEAAGRRGKNLDILGREKEIAAAVEQVAAIRASLADLELEYQASAVKQQGAAIAAQAALRLRTAAQGAVATQERDQERLHRQAGLMATVPCRGEGDYAGCALLKDARAALDSLPAVGAALAFTRKTLAQTPEPAPLVDETAPILTRKRVLERGLVLLTPVADLAAPMHAARARVEELDGQLAELGARQAAATARRDACAVRLAERPSCERSAKKAEQAVTLAQMQRSAAQTTLSQIEREVGQVEGQLAAVRAAGEACAAAMAEVGPVEESLGDWALLQRALSPSGIPALLVDQSLPELGRLASELLRECYGEEVFSIALTTQRESAAGDKLLETLDVVVRRDGNPIEAALLSGGEKVLVSEALSLALALYSAGRSGREISTLLRDEVGASLDVTRGPAYARMLRRAAALGGFSHVLYVSHDTGAVAAADAVIEVRDGTLSIN